MAEKINIIQAIQNYLKDPSAAEKQNETNNIHSVFGIGFKSLEGIGLKVETNDAESSNHSDQETYQADIEFDYQKRKDNAEQVALNVIRDGYCHVAEICDNLDYGLLGQARDNVREFFGSNKTSFKLKQQVQDQKDSLDLLQRARMGTLTKKEYYDVNKERLKKMLLDLIENFNEAHSIVNFVEEDGYRKFNRVHGSLEADIEAYIDNKIKNMKLPEIKRVQVELLKMDNDESAAFAQQMMQEISSPFTDKAPPPIPMGETNVESLEVIPFEDVYELECGHKFSIEEMERFECTKAKISIMKDLGDKLSEVENIVNKIDSYGKIENITPNLALPQDNARIAQPIEMYNLHAPITEGEEYYNDVYLDKKLSDFSLLLSVYYEMNPDLAITELEEIMQKKFHFSDNRNLPFSVEVDDTGSILLTPKDINDPQNSKNLSKIMQGFVNKQREKYEQISKKIGSVENLAVQLAVQFDNIEGYNRAKELAKTLKEDDILDDIDDFFTDAGTVATATVVLGVLISLIPAPGTKSAGGTMIATGNSLLAGSFVTKQSVKTVEAISRREVDLEALSTIGKETIFGLATRGIGGVAQRYGAKTFAKYAGDSLNAFKNKGVKEIFTYIKNNPKVIATLANAQLHKMGRKFMINYAGDMLMTGIIGSEDDIDDLVLKDIKSSL